RVRVRVQSGFEGALRCIDSTGDRVDLLCARVHGTEGAPGPCSDRGLPEELALAVETEDASCAIDETKQCVDREISHQRPHDSYYGPEDSGAATIRRDIVREEVLKQAPVTGATRGSHAPSRTDE